MSTADGEMLAIFKSFSAKSFDAIKVLLKVNIYMFSWVEQEENYELLTWYM
jgi:hypothetical protein